MSDPDRARRCEFVVGTRLPPLTLAAFDELAARHDGCGTVLSGVVRDESHLAVLLDRFDGLGVEVELVVELGGGPGAADRREPTAQGPAA